MKKVDIGCGTNKRPGYIGVDRLMVAGIDVQHDLDSFPYPFSDGEVDEVWMDNVLEHLQHPVRTMEEIYRICRDGGKVFVGVPYFRSYHAAGDPTHRNFFSVQWFNYFDPRHAYFKKYRYTAAQFLINRVEFDREFKSHKMSLFHRLLVWIAERKSTGYEARLSHLFPLNSLTFHLIVKK